MSHTHPEVIGERCVRHRFRFSDCSRCADGCPVSAITAGDEGVVIDAGRCIDCGLCVAACPTATFRTDSIPFGALARPKGRTLTVACRPSEEAGDVRLPCLGALDAALLASLALRGVKVTLAGSGHCTDCLSAPQGMNRTLALVETVTEMAGEHPPPEWIPPVLQAEVKEGAGIDRQGAKRRQLLRRMSAWNIPKEASAMSPEAVPASAIRSAAHFVPARRALAEEVLRRLAPRELGPVTGTLLHIGFIHPGSNPCTGCDACARVCPTGALRIHEVETTWRLDFVPNHCVACGVCVEVCRNSALEFAWRWEGDSSGSVVHELSRYRCPECGRYTIGADVDECPICQDDEADFAAIFG